MNVMLNFEERKREKQLLYERKLLRELSIEEVKKSMIVHFNRMRIGVGPLEEGVEEACFDVAIEAYLNGGEFSRFTIHGETIEMVKKRSHREITHFIDTLYYFWLYWDFEKRMISDEDIFIACEHFVDYWWINGYRKGERRYKLRLH